MFVSHSGVGWGQEGLVHLLLLSLCCSTEILRLAYEQLSINTIRTLSMDAVQAANSGHAGTPMALAPLVYYLWQRLLRYDPDNKTHLLEDTNHLES